MFQSQIFACRKPWSPPMSCASMLHVLWSMRAGWKRLRRTEHCWVGPVGVYPKSWRYDETLYPKMAVENGKNAWTCWWSVRLLGFPVVPRFSLIFQPSWARLGPHELWQTFRTARLNWLERSSSALRSWSRLEKQQVFGQDLKREKQRKATTFLHFQ